MTEREAIRILNHMLADVSTYSDMEPLKKYVEMFVRLVDDPEEDSEFINLEDFLEPKDRDIEADGELADFLEDYWRI